MKPGHGGQLKIKTVPSNNVIAGPLFQLLAELDFIMRIPGLKDKYAI